MPAYECEMTNLDSKQKEYLSQNFNAVNLPAKEIHSVEFDGCTFNECDFSESIFNACKFIDCLFLKCNLSVVNIAHSKFSDVTFDECKIVGVDWTQASWASFKLPSPIKFQKCIINDSSFFGLSLEEMVLEECKAHDVDFREGDFCESNFTYTDFLNSLFNNTNLAGADFTEAVNYNIDIYFNEIKRAKFSRYEAVRLLNNLDIELVD